MSCPAVMTMTTRSRAARCGSALCAGLMAVACTATPPAAVTTPSATPPPVSPEQAALATYAEFWRVTDAARAAPSARDWTPQIEAVAEGDALQAALKDVKNYASLPAHTVGAITRHPVVASATASRVSVVDCVDLGDSRLVSDRDGKSFDDLVHRVQRFRLRADIVTAADGRWLVSTSVPALSEPC
jgi:hypothetical protein